MSFSHDAVHDMFCARVGRKLLDGETVVVGRCTYLTKPSYLHDATSGADWTVAPATAKAMLVRGLVTIQNHGEFRFLKITDAGRAALRGDE